MAAVIVSCSGHNGEHQCCLLNGEFILAPSEKRSLSLSLSLCEGSTQKEPREQ